jgi:Domain of unknown function (DUF222)
MFDGRLEDRVGVLVAAEANLRARRDADVELLQVALGWADLHLEESLPAPADEIEARRRRLADRVGVRMGGAGTPLVMAYCPAELGAVLETTAAGARHLIADALDLRNRLPRLWTTVRQGRVAAWKARRVAAATRALTAPQVAEVDEVVHGVIATLGWSRFEAILDATIKQTDPDGARAAEQDAATRRFVAVGRANDHHIRTLTAHGTSLDILSFMAAVNRIADLLGAEGDADSIDIRRSKAIGVFARPAHALELLARHRTPGTSEAAEDDGEPDPDGDDHLSSPPDSPLRREGHCCGCAPRIRLHVHLTDAALRGADPQAVCRIEGLGPVTAQTVRDWLGRSDIAVTLQPVVLPDPPPVDGYEIPQAIRDALAARHPASVYPWSQSAGPAVDLDHTTAYVPLEKGGPPGQTGVGTLGPLARREHRHKTFGHLKVRQAVPGVYFWRSRHGWVWLVTKHRHSRPRPRPRSRRLLASRRTEGRSGTPTDHGSSSNRSAAPPPDRPDPPQRQGPAHPAHVNTADTVRACAGRGRSQSSTATLRARAVKSWWAGCRRSRGTPSSTSGCSCRTTPTICVG